MKYVERRVIARARLLRVSLPTIGGTMTTQARPIDHELRSGGARPPAGGLPSACGALGEYEPERVRQIAAGFDADLGSVHEQAGAVLMLDREPLRWEGPDGWGLGWSQGLAPAGRIRSWRDAARAAGACGLAVDRGRVVVHTDVSGIGPVYYTSVGRAVYFATRIDPLVQAATELLHPDWEAWAAILAINLPLGDRTPFAEIKRLGPFATLAGAATGPEVRAEPWPWAQQDAPHDLDAGTPDVVAAMRAAVDRLPRGPVALPLTGGGDSRVLLSLLRGDPDRPRAASRPPRTSGTGRRRSSPVPSLEPPRCGTRPSTRSPSCGGTTSAATRC